LFEVSFVYALRHNTEWRHMALHYAPEFCFDRLFCTRSSAPQPVTKATGDGVGLSRPGQGKPEGGRLNIEKEREK
jgi:hypothetical protein